MLVATDRSLRLCMDGSWLDPSRVLRPVEHENDWLYLSQPHILEYMILPAPERAAHLLGMNVERIVRRHADFREGLAPPGWGAQ